MHWKFWRKYRSVKYSFSCKNTNWKKIFWNQQNCILSEEYFLSNFNFQKAFEKIQIQKRKLFLFKNVFHLHMFAIPISSILGVSFNTNSSKPEWKLKRVNSVHCWELQYSRNYYYRGSRRSKRSSTTAVRHTQATHIGVKFFLKEHVHFHSTPGISLNI